MPCAAGTSKLSFVPKLLFLGREEPTKFLNTQWHVLPQVRAASAALCSVDQPVGPGPGGGPRLHAVVINRLRSGFFY